MAEIQQQIQSLRTLQTQVNENELVLKELELSTPECEVFKIRGIGLTLMDKDEAVANVKKRLDFINKEKNRVEKSIKEYKKSQNSENKK